MLCVDSCNYNDINLINIDNTLNETNINNAAESLATPPSTPQLIPLKCKEEFTEFNNNNEPVESILLDSNRLTLSTLKSKDVEMIKSFTNQYLEVSYSSGFFLQFLTVQGCICLQLMSSEHPGKILGVISGRISLDKTFGTKLSGQVYTLAVDDQFRRCGLGSLLLKELEDEMKFIANRMDCSLSSLSLEVKSTDSNALKFYDRLGFESCGVELGYYRHGGDCVRMKKTI